MEDRRHASIMFTDIARYTTLMESDEFFLSATQKSMVNRPESINNVFSNPDYV